MKIRDLPLLAPPRWEFWCPGCARGHTVAKRDPAKKKDDGRDWVLSGTAEAPSLDKPVKITGNAMFSIPSCTVSLREGLLTYGKDSSHDLAGKTVPLPNFPAPEARKQASRRPPASPLPPEPSPEATLEHGPRVRVVQTSPPQWSIWCTACSPQGREHVFDARWEFSGDLDKPTLKGSILAHPFPAKEWKRCHSLVHEGEIAYCSDSDHGMRGMKMRLSVHPYGRPEPLSEITPKERVTMTVKTIPARLRHPETGELVDAHVKLGRLRPKSRPKVVKLRDFVRKDKLEAIPETVNNTTSAALPALRNIYLNNTLGCCVIAAGYHCLAVWTALAGALFEATDEQITADYSAIGGYVPGDPSTDNGCDEDTALNTWKTKGFADGATILTWVEIDGSNWDEFCLALSLFECLFGTLELPDPYIHPFPSDGTVWDVGAPDPSNGHGIMFTGYDRSKNEASVDTWGVFPLMTKAAIAALCVESAGGGIYLALTAAMLAKAQTKAPNGVDWTALLQAAENLGAPAPPAPAPDPAPAPAPTPQPPPTATSDPTAPTALLPPPPTSGPPDMPPSDSLRAPSLFAVQTWVQMALSAWDKPTLSKNEALSLINGALSKQWPKKAPSSVGVSRSLPVPIPVRQNQSVVNRTGQIPIPKPAARSQPVANPRSPRPQIPVAKPIAPAPPASEVVQDAGGPAGAARPTRQIWPPPGLQRR